MAASICKICKALPSKYKCPSCSIRYCGVGCFREHKVECEGTAPKPLVVPTAAAGDDPLPSPASDMTVEEEGVLTDAQLERLLLDPEVMTALRDPRLQRVLRAIDGAKDRVEALNTAKKIEGRQFHDFIDRMLIAIGVCERGPDGNVVFVA